MAEAAPYRALSMLENEYAPTLNRRSPYWRPLPAKPWRDIHTPAWSWTHPAYTGQALDLTHLDVNAAYLSAASSGSFAHGALERTGSMSPDQARFPGYYQIDAHPWQIPAIVSPLGSAELPARVWVAYPTIELLAQRLREGYWPDLTIYDSWTSETSVKLAAWATAVNADRCAALLERHRAQEAGDQTAANAATARYEAIKTGYSIAIQLLLGPAPGATVKAAVKRPDWYHTIHAQHAASTWRKVWQLYRQGNGFVPVMMGSIDQVTYLSADFDEIRRRTTEEGRALIRLDQSGQKMGCFKIKDTEMAHV